MLGHASSDSYACVSVVPRSRYKQFDLVIAGLDNIEARQWLNATLVQLVEFDEDGQIDPDTVIPLIDGGTEGFQGQARVFLPRVTSCFECSLASMPPQAGFAVCTIRNVPRIPERQSKHAHAHPLAAAPMHAC